MPMSSPQMTRMLGFLLDLALLGMNGLLNSSSGSWHSPRHPVTAVPRTTNSARLEAMELGRGTVQQQPYRGPILTARGVVTYFDRSVETAPHEQITRHQIARAQAL